MRDVKKAIIEERVVQRHFLSDYHIDYEPMKKLLKFSFDCPAPLMKVQIYKKNGLNSYEAILVSSGELYDPTYEVVLRSEQMLTKQLPFLGFAGGRFQPRIAGEYRQFGQKLGRKLWQEVVGDHFE